MKFLNCEFRPGKVLQVVDYKGTIKCSCIGVFDENEDPDLLPPVRQFLRLSPTGFAKPQVGDDIWVMLFSDNTQALYYIFRGDVDKDTGLSNDYNDVEILLNRSTDHDTTVEYNSTDGLIMSNDGSTINIANEDNSVTMTDGKTGDSIAINDNGISLGSADRSRYRAVKGERCVDVMDDLYSIMDEIADTAAKSPDVAAFGTALKALLKLHYYKQLNDSGTLDKMVLSDKVTLD